MLDLLDDELRHPRMFLQKLTGDDDDDNDDNDDLLESIKKNPDQFIELVRLHKHVLFSNRDAKIRVIELAFESDNLDVISTVPRVFPKVGLYNYLNYVVVPVIRRNDTTCGWTPIDFLNHNEVFLSSLLWTALLEDEENADPDNFWTPEDRPKPKFLTACGFLYDAALSAEDFEVTRWLRDRNFVLPYHTFFKWRCHVKKIHQLFRNFAYCSRLLEDIPSDEVGLVADVKTLLE